MKSIRKKIGLNLEEPTVSLIKDPLLKEEKSATEELMKLIWENQMFSYSASYPPMMASSGTNQSPLLVSNKQPGAITPNNMKSSFTDQEKRTLRKLLPYEIMAEGKDIPARLSLFNEISRDNDAYKRLVPTELLILFSRGAGTRILESVFSPQEIAEMKKNMKPATLFSQSATVPGTTTRVSGITNTDSKWWLNTSSNLVDVDLNSPNSMATLTTKVYTDGVGSTSSIKDPLTQNDELFF